MSLDLMLNAPLLKADYRLDSNTKKVKLPCHLSFVFSVKSLPLVIFDLFPSRLLSSPALVRSFLTVPSCLRLMVVDPPHASKTKFCLHLSSKPIVMASNRSNESRVKILALLTFG